MLLAVVRETLLWNAPNFLLSTVLKFIVVDNLNGGKCGNPTFGELQWQSLGKEDKLAARSAWMTSCSLVRNKTTSSAMVRALRQCRQPVSQLQWHSSTGCISPFPLFWKIYILRCSSITVLSCSQATYYKATAYNLRFLRTAVHDLIGILVKKKPVTSTKYVGIITGNKGGGIYHIVNRGVNNRAKKAG